jgi:hypothetical protein
VKQATIVNTAARSGQALEKALAAKLREFLGRVSWLRNVKVFQNPTPFDRVFDIEARVTLPTGSFAELWVTCHDLPLPWRVPYVALENEFHAGGKRTTRVPVLAAPLITGRMAELCEKHHWSWFDLAGNCRLVVPVGVFIERRGNDPVHRRPKPAANLGTAESTRILRALLAPANAGRRWMQRWFSSARPARLGCGVARGKSLRPALAARILHAQAGPPIARSAGLTRSVYGAGAQSTQ